MEPALSDNFPRVPVVHPAWSIFSIKIPYPRVGSFTKTWVTAPIIFPFWRIGEPAHALDDSTGFFKQSFIRYLDFDSTVDVVVI